MIEVNSLFGKNETKLMDKFVEDMGKAGIDATYTPDVYKQLVFVTLSKDGMATERQIGIRVLRCVLAKECLETIKHNVISEFKTLENTKKAV